MTTSHDMRKIRNRRRRWTLLLVPSAARLLCADGAAAGGRSLYNAIFDYNHANWYVNEVLSLAAQYGADYR